MATATATVKPTRRPTRRPTNTPVPRPTNTPLPPFTAYVTGSQNCSMAGVEGLVQHASGDPYADIAVGVWSGSWPGRVTTSEPNGKFSLRLTDLPPGQFQVAVVRLESCNKQGDDWTAVDCQRLSAPVDITITAECEGPGASNVAYIEFTGP
jgi:hypothetical protein